MVQYRNGRPSPWMVQIRVGGKVVTHSFERKADAVAFEDAERRKRQLQRAGLEAPKDAILFIDYAKIFIQRRFKERPYSTARQDESRLRNYWLERFGHRPMQGIASSEIKERLDEIQFQGGHTPADRNRHRALLHRLFKEAVMDDKLLYNPVSKIPLVDERKGRAASEYLETQADQDAYIRAAYAEGSQWGVLAVILIWAGPRIGEALALQYRDIDFEKETIRIRRIYDKATNSIQERTKGGGETVLPLFARVRDAVLAHRQKSDYTRPADFIVCRNGGAFIPYDSFKGVHRRILERAGLKAITIHDLRRTFASNAQRAGFSKSEIQEMLGHSSVTVTEKYTVMEIDHLVEKGKRLGFGETCVSALSAKKKRGVGPKRRKYA